MNIIVVCDNFVTPRTNRRDREREEIGQRVATGSDLFCTKMLLEYLLVCLKRNCYSLVELVELARLRLIRVR